MVPADGLQLAHSRLLLGSLLLVLALPRNLRHRGWLMGHRRCERLVNATQHASSFKYLA